MTLKLVCTKFYAPSIAQTVDVSQNLYTDIIMGKLLLCNRKIIKWNRKAIKWLERARIGIYCLQDSYVSSGVGLKLKRVNVTFRITYTQYYLCYLVWLSSWGNIYLLNNNFKFITKKKTKKNTITFGSRYSYLILNAFWKWRHNYAKLVPHSKPTLGTGIGQSNHGAHWSLSMAFSISHTELSILITHFTCIYIYLINTKKTHIISSANHCVCNVSVSQLWTLAEIPRAEFCPLSFRPYLL